MKSEGRTLREMVVEWRATLDGCARGHHLSSLPIPDLLRLLAVAEAAEAYVNAQETFENYQGVGIDGTAIPDPSLYVALRCAVRGRS